MKIIIASIKDASTIANIVSESNKDVAIKFGINNKNNPKHPSFIQKSGCYLI